MTTCQELEEIYPAFALDAVDAPERARVERHLAECPACAQIVATYRPVVELLPFAAPPAEPPAHLKQRVLAALQPAAPRRPARTAVHFDLASRFADFFRAPVFAAATFALVIAFGVWNVALQSQLTHQAAFNQQMQGEMARQREFVSAIAYADSQPRLMQATDAAFHAVGRLYVAPELHALALIVYDLPTLPTQQVYQVWLIDHAGGRTSGGMFTVDDEGSGWLVIELPRALEQFQGVGITVEPAGGSPQPTTPRVMGASL